MVGEGEVVDVKVVRGDMAVEEAVAVDVVRVVAPLVALIIPTMSGIYCLNLSMRFFPSLEGNRRRWRLDMPLILQTVAAQENR
jgi:hypothetical protein